jgi:hypothetical protein
MRSNKTFSLEVSFFAVSNGKELGTGLAPLCDFGDTRNPVALIAVNILRPMDIPSQVLLDLRLTASLKTAKPLEIHTDPHALSLTRRGIE